jgi:hypothetical protein
MKRDSATTFPGATKIDLMYKDSVQSVAGDAITPALRGIAELLVTATIPTAKRVVISETGLIEDEQAYNWEYITETLKVKCNLDWTAATPALANQIEIYFIAYKPKAVIINSKPSGIKEITNALGSISFYEGGGTIDIRSELDSLVENICTRYGTHVEESVENTTDWYSGSLRRTNGNIIPL